MERFLPGRILPMSAILGHTWANLGTERGPSSTNMGRCRCRMHGLLGGGWLLRKGKLAGVRRGAAHPRHGWTRHVRQDGPARPAREWRDASWWRSARRLAADGVGGAAASARALLAQEEPVERLLGPEFLDLARDRAAWHAPGSSTAHRRLRRVALGSSHPASLRSRPRSNHPPQSLRATSVDLAARRFRVGPEHLQASSVGSVTSSGLQSVGKQGLVAAGAGLDLGSKGLGLSTKVTSSLYSGLLNTVQDRVRRRVGSWSCPEGCGFLAQDVQRAAPCGRDYNLPC